MHNIPSDRRRASLAAPPWLLGAACALLAGCTSSPAGQPVAARQLTFENLDGLPSPDRLVFSRIGAPGVSVTHDTASLRLRSGGAAPLTLKALRVSGPWTLLNAPALPKRLAPGEQLDLTLLFQGAAGVSSGSLSVVSDDSAAPNGAVQLAGYAQSVPENGVPENNGAPSLAQLLGLFGYTTAVTNAEQVLDQHGLVSAVGDEVLSPYWRAADPTAPVEVREIAAYRTPGQPSTLFWHVRGDQAASPILSDPGSGAQTVLPRLPDGSPVQASFRADDQAFGFRVNGDAWSDFLLNPQSADLAAGCAGPCGHRLRFWPLKDGRGAVVPNSYLLGMSDAGANDYQDNVYLISNITPDPVLYRVNVGGPAYRDARGNAWSADAGLFFTTPPYQAPAEPPGGPSSAPIRNTDNPTLYQSYRAVITDQNGRQAPLPQRVLSFRLPVRSKTVDLRLHFAELCWGGYCTPGDGSGKRIFDVAVEGHTVLNDLDIYAKSGGAYTAYDVPLNGVAVQGGVLSVVLTPKLDFGALSGLEVFEHP